MKTRHLLFGKIGESTAPPGQLDVNAILKIVRTALMAGIAVFLGVIAKEIGGVDFIPNSGIDEIVVTGLLMPLVELIRRKIADYSEPDMGSLPDKKTGEKIGLEDLPVS